ARVSSILRCRSSASVGLFFSGIVCAAPVAAPAATRAFKRSRRFIDLSPIKGMVLACEAVERDDLVLLSDDSRSSGQGSPVQAVGAYLDPCHGRHVGSPPPPPAV